MVVKKYILLATISILIVLSSSCDWVAKSKDSTPTLLKVEEAPKEKLLAEIERFASINSISAKMDLQYVDTSFAQKGSATTYLAVNGNFVVQRPANIYVKVDGYTVDVAQMTSDGEKFRVAVLWAGSCSECKKFIIGTNQADYSPLEKSLKSEVNVNAKDVSSFANMRPQHFTDAILVRPIIPENVYLQSTIYQVEEDKSQNKNSPLRNVMRGYYLLDEYQKAATGELKISRRFWFDRVGAIRFARQQLFDAKGEIESDIVYGQEGNLTSTGEYRNLPLRIQVTRPKEKYTISLTYQKPENVKIGTVYKKEAFELKNTWGLPEFDLDRKLSQPEAH